MSNRQKNSHTNKGGVYMATSSITKNFIISGQKQVEMFVDAIESSANNRPVRVPVAAHSSICETDKRRSRVEKIHGKEEESGCRSEIIIR